MGANLSWPQSAPVHGAKHEHTPVAVLHVPVSVQSVSSAHGPPAPEPTAVTHMPAGCCADTLASIMPAAGAPTEKKPFQASLLHVQLESMPPCVFQATQPSATCASNTPPFASRNTHVCSALPPATQGIIASCAGEGAV